MKSYFLVFCLVFVSFTPYESKKPVIPKVLVKQRVIPKPVSVTTTGSSFEILSRKPEMFAATISICGAGNPKTAKMYAKSKPFGVFYGAKDNVVNPQASVDIVGGVLKHGGKPNFTMYSKDNHNSWDTAFAEPELLPWLFSNIKK